MVQEGSELLYTECLRRIGQYLGGHSIGHSKRKSIFIVSQEKGQRGHSIGHSKQENVYRMHQ
jgi:hypothetical protein